MRILFLFYILIFTGCATQSAFTKLDMTSEEKLAIEDTHSGKMSSTDGIDGVYSVIYLNKIYQSKYMQGHHFYVTVYSKSNNTDVGITLNGLKPNTLIELQEDNKYSDLIPVKRLWTKRYLAIFDKVEQSKVILSIDNGQFSSGPINYLIE